MTTTSTEFRPPVAMQPGFVCLFLHLMKNSEEYRKIQNETEEALLTYRVKEDHELIISIL